MIRACERSHLLVEGRGCVQWVNGRCPLHPQSTSIFYPLQHLQIRLLPHSVRAAYSPLILHLSLVVGNLLHCWLVYVPVPYLLILAVGACIWYSELCVVLFTKVSGLKDLVLDADLMKPLDRVAGASLLKVYFSSVNPSLSNNATLNIINIKRQSFTTTKNEWKVDCLPIAHICAHDTVSNWHLTFWVDFAFWHMRGIL